MRWLFLERPESIPGGVPVDENRAIERYKREFVRAEGGDAVIGPSKDYASTRLYGEAREVVIGTMPPLDDERRGVQVHTAADAALLLYLPSSKECHEDPTYPLLSMHFVVIQNTSRHSIISTRWAYPLDDSLSG